MALPTTHEVTTGDGRVLRYCLYGPADGFPVLSHSGSPGSRWKWPRLAGAMGRSGLRHLVYDRPGYGGSTRRPGRRVADAAGDAAALAEAQGWERFGVFGGSGGGPHALACAALLPGRVTRCAVLSGVRPRAGGSSAKGPSSERPSSERPSSDPAGGADLRRRLAGTAAGILAAIDAGGPEVPWEPGPPVRDDPDAMARIRATFVDSMDGWVDDSLAFGRDWGFSPAAIGVPVGVWRGTSDPSVPAEHAAWLLAHIPGAAGFVYDGGHVPGVEVYEQIYGWLGG